MNVYGLRNWVVMLFEIFHAEYTETAEPTGSFPSLIHKTYFYN
jgi:hypothetical protein